ncbi:purine-cytosine permease family protein [Microbacterium karelineae]|uniref:purine-cytosine permease family protein n=1 Tax=Microbacterium karelineae TaxID=2654283 RepID=UPI0027D21B02|nr:cytosine permease [Microbacterium karelineae]
MSSERRRETPADATGPVTGTLATPRVGMIWLAANLVVTTLLTGTLFVPGIDYGGAIAMIVVGTLAGAAVLAAVGNIGTRTGLPTMALTRGSFGTRGSLLPLAANVFVLMGWSWVQAMLAGVTVDALVSQLTGYSNPVLFSVLCQAIVVVLAIFGHEGIARVEPWLAVLMLVVIGWMFIQGFRAFPPAEYFEIRPTGELTHVFVLDIVIATAISWTVLSADFNRLARTSRAGIVGSVAGYATSTIVSMSLGATAFAYILLSGTDAAQFDPTALVTAFGAPIAIVIFISVMATNTMVVYGMTTSVMNSLPGRQPRFLPTALVLGAVSIAGSMWLALLDQFTTFLVMIGAFFVPVFAIMIVDYYIIRRSSYSADILRATGGRYWFVGGVNPIAIAAWLVGAVVSYLLTYVWPSPIGATAAAFVVTFLIYLAAMLPFRARSHTERSVHLAAVPD